ncbi:glycosyltransferase family 2 protein [Sandarakinorhabdus sp.]|uniref:glycosyltransferase family 2 protein n=1 Tax=Sandarakinorhabdus sp. TaxID=1916663 RepID=UPI00286EB297|nr:glycosyltransferase family 2 protein [Sandarakinorhabdus sp.]
MSLFRDNTANSQRLGVVLVNYKRAADTIECLESLMRSTVQVQVVVVDNGSADGSIDAITAWAAGMAPATAASPDMAPLSSPPLLKPWPLRRMTAEQARIVPPQGPLTLIDAGDNLGFAGGNNLGMAHLLQSDRIGNIWLLNNDTVVAADAAQAILARMTAVPNVGMCGTVVRFYWQPDTVQALGGSTFNLVTGNSASIGGGTLATMGFNPQLVADTMDFVLGASLVVSRKFLEAVGPMSERYFLYFEEIDWAVRNRRRGEAAFETAFAHSAVVWHKEGGSIGSSSKKGQRSGFSDYWLTRSRLRFVAHFYPLLLPWHAVWTLALILRRLMRGQGSKASAMLRALTGRRY